MFPEVSIIMPAFNCCRTIQASIDSVLSQTHKKWELIIINDGSSDATGSVVKKYASLDERIQVINLRKNLGAGPARNIAIVAAAGRFVAFLDSDDVWCPEKLQLQTEFMKANDYAFAYHDYSIIDKEGALRKNLRCESRFDYKKYLSNNGIGVLTIMIDTSKVDLPRMSDQPATEAVGCWLEILQQGFFAYRLPMNLASYRLTPNSVSRNKVRARYWYWRVMRDRLKISFASALVYLVLSSLNAYKKAK